MDGINDTVLKLLPTCLLTVCLQHASSKKKNQENLTFTLFDYPATYLTAMW